MRRARGPARECGSRRAPPGSGRQAVSTTVRTAMDELRALFTGFLDRAGKAVINMDDPETRLIGEALEPSKLAGYGFDSPLASLVGRNLKLEADGVRFTIECGEEVCEVRRACFGRRHRLPSRAREIGGTYRAGRDEAPERQGADGPLPHRGAPVYKHLTTGSTSDGDVAKNLPPRAVANRRP